MGDSKQDMKDEDLATVSVENIDIHPEESELTGPLGIEVDFSTDRLLEDAYWEVKYIVDSVNKRHIIILGRTESTDYPEGPSSFVFQVDAVDVSGIRASAFSNAGLLVATLHSGREEVIDINMVVQVQRRGDEFYRTIFNPLE